MAFLKVIEAADPNLRERILEIDGEEVTLGRGKDCDVILDDAAISRTHTRLLSTADGHILEDNSSANGTWVNGVRVTREKLRPGDQIRLGKTVLVYETTLETAEGQSAVPLIGQPDRSGEPRPQEPPQAAQALPQPRRAPPPPPPPALPEAFSVEASPLQEASPTPVGTRPGAEPPGPLWPRPVEATRPGEDLLADAPPAGFWIRLGAQVLDALVTGAVVAVLLIPVAIIWGGQLLEEGPLRSEALTGIPILGFAVSALYHVGFWRSSGATPGKRVLGIRIVRADGGGPLGTGKALVRFLGYVVSAIPLGAGYLMVAFSREKAALHDILSGTRVVREG